MPGITVGRENARAVAEMQRTDCFDPFNLSDLRLKLQAVIMERNALMAVANKELPPFPERLRWSFGGWKNGTGEYVGLSSEQVDAYMDAAEAFRDAVVGIALDPPTALTHSYSDLGGYEPYGSEEKHS
jgi:hypothetical protein